MVTKRTSAMVQKFSRYARRIRNLHKKTYAWEYWRHLVTDGPEPVYGGQSYMAAQAVRQEIANILRQEGK